MDQRKLGSQGLEVSAMGLGCMGISKFYSGRDDVEPVATINRALDLGDFLDSADMYGVRKNEELVGRAVRERCEWAIVATKFGNVRGADGSYHEISGKPEYVRQACDMSLKRLGLDFTDPTGDGWTPEDIEAMRAQKLPFLCHALEAAWRRSRRRTSADQAQTPVD